MNYIRHLNVFFNYVRKDHRIASAHVSLYMAMFQYWNLNRFQNPFAVYRNDMMQLSKIGSKNTYHKCLKDLHLAGYIFQHVPPSKCVPVKISMVRLDLKQPEHVYQQLDLFNVDNPTSPCTNNETHRVPDLTATCPRFETEPVPNMGHLLKLNNKHIEREANAHKKNVDNCPKKLVEKKVEKMEVEKNNLQQNDSLSLNTPLANNTNGLPARVSNSVHDVPPTLVAVQAFFQESHYPPQEGLKFFHHYNGNGWRIGGKIPMQNWQSSAIKWMLNTNSFTNLPPSIQNTHALYPDKDYSQPL